MDWNEEYWPLVIQLYENKPRGIKPMYGYDTVKLAIELHIPPGVIYEKMFELRQPSRPSLRRLIKSLAGNREKLNLRCRQLRALQGMGNADEFYEGVALNETFETDFKPVNAPTALMTRRPLYTPAMLIMILDLYFRLVPQTMVTETPEVKETAKLMDITPQDVTDILDIYTYCDPFMKHADSLIDPMLPPCMRVWRRFCTAEHPDITALSNLAQQMKAYWK